MGNSQSIDTSHLRIWQNLVNITNPATKAGMLETLLNAPEYVAAAKRAGVYADCLQWLASYRRGETRPVQEFKNPANQQIIAHPAPRKAHDYFSECCELLNLDESIPLTREAIKTAYKRAAVKTHPDRGGDPELFDAVTRASLYLFKIIDRVAGIKAASESFSAPLPQTREQLMGLETQRSSAVAKIQQGPPVSLNAKKLDMSVFNKLFEENRLPDPERDDGYGDWLKSQGGNDSVKDNAKLRGKFAIDTFNQIFDKQSNNHSSRDSIQQYNDPSAIMMQPAYGVTLGADKPDDYTAPVGSQLQYTDLMSAYTKKSTFSQEVAGATAQLASRPTDLKSMERARSKPLEANSQETARIAAARQQEEAIERQRQMRAAHQDVAAQQYHQALQRRLLINN